MKHLFVSYSRQDAAYVERLVGWMRAHEIPTWVDHELDYGDRWASVIQTRLDEAAAVIVVVSPDSVRSEWVDREISYAQEARKPVLPLLLVRGTRSIRLTAIHHEDVTGGGLPSDQFAARARVLAGLSAGLAPRPVSVPQIPGAAAATTEEPPADTEQVPSVATPDPVPPAPALVPAQPSPPPSATEADGSDPTPAGVDDGADARERTALRLLRATTVCYLVGAGWEQVEGWTAEGKSADLPWLLIFYSLPYWLGYLERRKRLRSGTPSAVAWPLRVLVVVWAGLTLGVGTSLVITNQFFVFGLLMAVGSLLMLMAALLWARIDLRRWRRTRVAPGQ